MSCYQFHKRDVLPSNISHRFLTHTELAISSRWIAKKKCTDIIHTVSPTANEQANNCFGKLVNSFLTCNSQQLPSILPNLVFFEDILIKRALWIIQGVPLIMNKKH